MKAIKRPVFKIIYADEDITADIVSKVQSLKYSDRQHGMADDVSIVISDNDRLWRERIFPEGGELLEVVIGYEGEELLPCGYFEIDQPEYDLETLVLNASSTSIKKALKEKINEKYNNMTLDSIIHKIADKHDLKVVGNIAPLKFKRKTQNCTDLEFLRKLAEDYGYLFTVKGDFLVFVPFEEIEEEEPLMTIDETELVSESLVVNEHSVYSACEVQYFRKGVKYKAKETAKNINNGTVLKEKRRCENNEQAAAIAKALLWRKNREHIKGNITVPGTTLLSAGNNFQLTGAGKLSGVYQVLSSTHKTGKNYTTTAEVFRVKS